MYQAENILFRQKYTAILSKSIVSGSTTVNIFDRDAIYTINIPAIFDSKAIIANRTW